MESSPKAGCSPAINAPTSLVWGYHPTRLAFSLIDRHLFPEPSWLLAVEAIDAKDADHALRQAAQHRISIETFDRPELKLAYFQGAIDAAFMADQARPA